MKHLGSVAFLLAGASLSGEARERARLNVARNVEIKARVGDLLALADRIEAIASDGPFELRQADTFFRCDTGRLKLRDFGDGSGELIFYRRADETGPRESFYLRSQTSTPNALRESLAMAYGECGHVAKRRTVYLVGRTRVHLDQVEGLGDFMEIEVVLADNEAIAPAVGEANRLMRTLGIAPQQLVDRPYVELASAHLFRVVTP